MCSFNSSFKFSLLIQYLDIAKDGNNSISTRATAAKDAVGDKFEQEKHENKADVAQKKSDL